MREFVQVSLLVGGIYNLAFAIFHLFFWKLFDWNKDLASLTPANRSIMQILNLCLIFMFGLMSYVSLVFRGQMLATGLGKTLLVAFALFWFLRMLEQIVVFEEKSRLSAVFTLIFLVGGVIYLVPALY